jgi:hypothetical protein
MRNADATAMRCILNQNKISAASIEQRHRKPIGVIGTSCSVTGAGQSGTC